METGGILNYPFDFVFPFSCIDTLYRFQKQTINSECVRNCTNGKKIVLNLIPFTQSKNNLFHVLGKCVNRNSCECNEGYKEQPKNSDVCEPVCMSKCENGKCVGPDKCECNNGYELDSSKNECQPVCSPACQFGNCIAPGKCQCNTGFKMDPKKHLCQPICPENCLFGHYAGPDECKCNDNHTMVVDNTYKCINCTEPNKCISPYNCLCEKGYYPDRRIVNGVNIVANICTTDLPPSIPNKNYTVPKMCDDFEGKQFFKCICGAFPPLCYILAILMTILFLVLIGVLLIPAIYRLHRYNRLSKFSFCSFTKIIFGFYLSFNLFQDNSLSKQQLFPSQSSILRTNSIYSP